MFLKQFRGCFMRVIVVKKEAIMFAVCLVAIALSGVYLVRTQVIDVIAMPASRKIIMIDAGHGGVDSGAKVGKINEKTINLAIAEKLQTYLEIGDAYVLMTRIDDKALSNSKKNDMYKRKIIANTSGADIFVSIHQNINRSSYPSGAQVYYFGSSPKSRLLAECIQQEIKNAGLPSHKTGTLSNTNYYVLRQTVMPSVLVECGFLSNANDRWLLQSEEFQGKMAWAIYMGILKYFESEQMIQVFESS